MQITAGSLIRLSWPGTTWHTHLSGALDWKFTLISKIKRSEVFERKSTPFRALSSHANVSDKSMKCVYEKFDRNHVDTSSFSIFSPFSSFFNDSSNKTNVDFIRFMTWKKWSLNDRISWTTYYFIYLVAPQWTRERSFIFEISFHLWLIIDALFLWWWWKRRNETKKIFHQETRRTETKQQPSGFKGNHSTG